jgi:hypothetical protein
VAAHPSFPWPLFLIQLFPLHLSILTHPSVLPRTDRRRRRQAISGRGPGRRRKRPGAGDAARRCPEPLRARRHLTVDRRHASVSSWPALGRSPYQLGFPRCMLCLARKTTLGRLILLTRAARMGQYPFGYPSHRQAGPACRVLKEKSLPPHRTAIGPARAESLGLVSFGPPTFF